MREFLFFWVNYPFNSLIYSLKLRKQHRIVWRFCEIWRNLQSIFKKRCTLSNLLNIFLKEKHPQAKWLPKQTSQNYYILQQKCSNKKIVSPSTFLYKVQYFLLQPHFIFFTSHKFSEILQSSKLFFFFLTCKFLSLETFKKLLERLREIWSSLKMVK